MKRPHHTHRVTSHQLGGPAVSLIKRDRKVPSVQVACPVCKAQPGDSCTKEDGQPYTKGSYHRDRRRMALRAGL